MLCVCVLGTKGSDDGVQKNAYREAEEATEVMVRRRAGTPTLARLCRSVWNIVKVYFFSKKSHSGPFIKKETKGLSLSERKKSVLRRFLLKQACAEHHLQEM